MREYEYQGPPVLGIAYKALFSGGFVDNQKEFSTKVLGKAPSYYSCMMARRRSPTLLVIRRLRDFVQNILQGFVGNPHLGTDYAVDLNTTHKNLVRVLRIIEGELKRREDAKQRFELPKLVYNRYDPVEALLRIAEIFTVLGFSRDDRDFSFRRLGLDTKFTADIADGRISEIPEGAVNQLRESISELREMEADTLANVQDKGQLWRARARYNLLHLADDLAVSFLAEHSIPPC